MISAVIRRATALCKSLTLLEQARYLKSLAPGQFDGQLLTMTPHQISLEIARIELSRASGNGRHGSPVPQALAA